MNKMLVVDDDHLSVKLIHLIFGGDFKIYHCNSAEEYYEKYCNIIFDLIIMDIAIKGNKNGFELIKEIKSAQSNCDTPILCLTAYSQSGIRKAAIESGADNILNKPVPNKELKNMINSLMKSRQANKNLQGN